jgi:hypothetical protein
MVLRGDDGTVLMDMPGFYDPAGVALVDVDGDGEVDAVSMLSGGRMVAIDRHGEVKWQSNAYGFWPAIGAITVADVDGDGIPEVFTPTYMVRGDDGTLITDFGRSGVGIQVPTIGDIDLDGEQEILIGRHVYRPDGTIKWSHDIVGFYGHWGAFVNIDDDPEAEVIIVGGGQIGIFEHDGTVISVNATEAAFWNGPICVADFDGDGNIEVAWASQYTFSVFHLDGSPLWTMPVSDRTGIAGCSGFDFDGDGAYEVLYADENTFYIFDGRTGTVRFSDPEHRNGTLIEYPTVADIDGDGSAEIVVSSFRLATGSGVTAYGHVDGNWPKSGETWPVHDFAVTNVLPDGTVPASPLPSWLLHNVYRARPAADMASVNLQVEITDACISSCVHGVGMAGLAVEVINNGASDVRIDIPITLYSDTDTALRPLATKWLRGGVPGGSRVGGVEFTVPIEDLERGFVVRVDDRGAGLGNVVECHEDDNETTWPYPVCD